MRSKVRLLALVVASVTGFAACVGGGSDLGPSIPKLPPGRYQLLVRNDSGAGVCNAFVAVAGLNAPAQPTRRSGRVDLYAMPTGRSLTVIDAQLATAGNGDALASLAFAADHSGYELPFVVYLPDLSPSAGAQVVAGVQPSTVTIDDSSTSGAIVTIPAGSAVSFGATATATVRTGGLAAAHIPPLAIAGASAVMTTDGAFVDPVDLVIDRDATISLPNDLGLAPGETAQLYRLDPSSGEWGDVGGGVVDSGGTCIESDPGAFARGGLYCFVREVGVTATLFGTTVLTTTYMNNTSTTVRRDVLVRAGQLTAVTDDNGNFMLTGVPVPDGPRDVDVEFTGGADLWPSAMSMSYSVGPGDSVDAGSIQVDMPPVTDYRLLLITRGEATPWGDLGAGITDGHTGGFGVTDSQARIDFPEVESGYMTFAHAALDPNSRQVFDTDGFLFVDNSHRNFDLRLFSDQRKWVTGNDGGTQCWFVDQASGAPIADAWISRLRNGTQESLDRTPRDQIARKDFGGNAEATISSQTESDGNTVVAAFTTRDVVTGRIEQPVPRADRQPLGEFESFAWASGTVPGTGDRFVLVTPPLRADTWLDAVFDDQSLTAATPVQLIPQVDGGDAFRLGVPHAGDVVGTFGTFGTSGTGTTTVDGFAFANDLLLDQASDNQLDLGAPIPFDTEYTITDAFVDRDTNIALSDFVPSVALHLGDGQAIDVARDIGGNLTVDGDDAQIRLPNLTGPLAGAHLLVALVGQANDGTVTRTQKSVVEIADASGATQSLLPVPEITVPAPGAQVSAGGFEVQFQLPVDAIYGFLRLVTDSGSEHHEWRALVPAGADSFQFRTLPAGPAVLVPGTWTLELTAAVLEPGSRAFDLSPFDAYDAVISRFFGIRRYPRAVVAESTVSFQVELVP